MFLFKKTTLLYFGTILLILLAFLEFYSSLQFEKDNALNSFTIFANSDALWLVHCCKEFIQKPTCISGWNFGTCYWVFPNIIIICLLSYILKSSTAPI